MTIDREQMLGVLLPKGHHIFPETVNLLRNKGIDIGEGRKNGSLHGMFKNFRGTWTQVDSRNINGEIVRGTYTQAGFEGSDFLADYMASLREDEPHLVVELLRFNLFDERMRVSVVGREDEVYHSPADFRGRRFIGRYPSLMREFLRQYFPEDEEIPVEIDTSITGGEEGIIQVGNADYAMVVVRTGDTLKRTGLRELARVEEHIEPVFVANMQAIQEKGLMPSLDEMVDRLRNGKKGSRRWDLPSAVSAVVSAMVVASNPFSTRK